VRHLPLAGPGRRRTVLRVRRALPRPPRRAAAALAAVLLAALPPGAAAAVADRAPLPAGGAVRPVAGPVVRPFDPPAHAYGPGHRGVDLAATPGAAVRAALPGRIAFSGVVAGTGWVSVDHGGGLRTTYGDLVDRRAQGRDVRAGDVVGRLAPDAAHLDWGARLESAYVDPLGLLARWRPHLVADGGTTGVSASGRSCASAGRGPPWCAAGTPGTR
jgi:murein DD-endopeptidase MepM/ murein hydrolase activator NlpD